MWSTKLFQGVEAQSLKAPGHGHPDTTLCHSIYKLVTHSERTAPVPSAAKEAGMGATLRMALVFHSARGTDQ